MAHDERQSSIRARREAYKDLITSRGVRDIRLEILELQAMDLGWKPPVLPVTRAMPAFPFLFSWEHEQRYEVRPCRWADHRLAVWQPHKPNIGRPTFTDTSRTGSAFHEVRWRKAVVEDLCTMCGEPIDMTDVLWMSIFDNPTPSGDGWVNVSFPLFHLECIRHSLNGCPFLRAGFGGFAPYRGRIRKRGIVLTCEGMEVSFGLKVHPDAKIIAHVVYQVPADEMKRLQELALIGCPHGLHWRDEDHQDG